MRQLRHHSSRVIKDPQRFSSGRVVGLVCFSWGSWSAHLRCWIMWTSTIRWVTRSADLRPVAARLAGGAIITLALVAPSFMAVQAWSGNIGVQKVSAPRTLPAFVAAEAAQSPQVGTLVIEAQGDSYLVTLSAEQARL